MIAKKSNASQKRRKFWIINGILLFLIVISIFAFFIIANFGPQWKQTQAGITSLNNNEPTATNSNSTSSPTPSPEPTPEPTPTPPPYYDAVWIGVGDIMSHSPQLPGAYDKDTDTYNFDSVFSEIIPQIKDGNWVMANLETPIAGKEI